MRIYPIIFRSARLLFILGRIGRILRIGWWWRSWTGTRWQWQSLWIHVLRSRHSLRSCQRRRGGLRTCRVLFSRHENSKLTASTTHTRTCSPRNPPKNWREFLRFRTALCYTICLTDCCLHSALKEQWAQKIVQLRSMALCRGHATQHCAVHHTVLPESWVGKFAQNRHFFKVYPQ